jgi:hypothetical protein
MVIPPKPWKDWRGGYMLKPQPVMRTHGHRSQMQVVKHVRPPPPPFFRVISFVVSCFVCTPCLRRQLPLRLLFWHIILGLYFILFLIFFHIVVWFGVMWCGVLLRVVVS